MLLKYKGKESQYLTSGHIYDVSISAVGEVIVVAPAKYAWSGWRCTYKSPAAFNKAWGKGS